MNSTFVVLSVFYSYQMVDELRQKIAVICSAGEDDLARFNCIVKHLQGNRR